MTDCLHEWVWLYNREFSSHTWTTTRTTVKGKYKCAKCGEVKWGARR